MRTLATPLLIAVGLLAAGPTLGVEPRTDANTAITDAGQACTDDAQCRALCVPRDDAYASGDCTNASGAVVCSARRRLLVREGDTLAGICAAPAPDARPANCTVHIVEGRLVIEGCAD